MLLFHWNYTASFLLFPNKFRSQDLQDFCVFFQLAGIREKNARCEKMILNIAKKKTKFCLDSIFNVFIFQSLCPVREGTEIVPIISFD